MSLKKKKKGNISNVPKSKKILLPTFNLLKSEVQVQETSLKKKMKGNVSNIPKSKKNERKFLSPPFTYSIPIPVQSPSSEDVPKEKKERECLVTFLNQKKNTFPHPSTYSSLKSKSRRRS
jgi:hypothetical protein